jgi:hypothetical protein
MRMGRCGLSCPRGSRALLLCWALPTTSRSQVDGNTYTLHVLVFHTLHFGWGASMLARPSLYSWCHPVMYMKVMRSMECPLGIDDQRES